jgi:hypothetical protein
MYWRIFMLKTQEIKYSLYCGASILMLLGFGLSFSIALANHCEPGMIHDPDSNNSPSTCVIESKKQGEPVRDASNQTLSNDGIFGCLGLGASVQNVGTRAARGSVYVPVSDAAVTENTGFLVYKECLLDGTTRKIAQNISAQYLSTQFRAAATGRNGGPQFPSNMREELTRRGNIILLNFMNDSNVGVLCPAFKVPVRTSAVRQYLERQQRPNQAFACSLPTDPNASFYETLAALRYPQNNPYGAALIVQAQIDSTLAYDEYNLRQRLLANNGFYDQVDNIDDPLGERVITPGFIIAEALAQSAGSGFRQLENANEIDQVVSNLFGGLTTQLVSDTRGLVGLSQSTNGQPSYLDRMTAQTSADVRQNAANVAARAINSHRTFEVQYLRAKEGIATALSDAILKLRDAEHQCWNLIIPKVEEHAQSNGNPTLRIATSTEFSQPVIDAEIAPLATTTIRDIRTSESAVALLTQLLTDVRNNDSQANQQQAVLKIDSLVANRQLHTERDALNAETLRDTVVTAVKKLVDDTIKSWGDAPDASIGWCNVNNADVVERWFNAWRN